MNPEQTTRPPIGPGLVPGASNPEHRLTPDQSSALDRLVPAYVFERPIRLIEDGVLFNGRAPNIRAYVLDWVRNPDPGSVFAARTKQLRRLPDTLLCAAMQLMKYDGLVFSEGTEIIAHTFFQRRQDALHMFSVSVDEGFRKRGYAEKALIKLIDVAREEPGISRIRFGSNGHEAVQRIYEKFEKRQAELGLRVHSEGWADILRVRS